MGTCPFVPGAPHLLAGSWSSPRAFGSAYPGRGDLHPTSAVPCLAHTAQAERRGSPRPLQRFVSLLGYWLRCGIRRKNVDFLSDSV
jgi:hypothetical protein